MLTVRFVRGVADVEPTAWDALVGPDGSPFFEHAFLRAAEAASAVPERGVLPAHATAWDGDDLVAALPLYVKLDGRGEFIYDYGWSWSAERAGVAYYPKVVSMPPFSPVPGRHVLAAPGADAAGLTAALAEAVEEWAREQDLKGLHYLFLPEDEAAVFEGLGYVRRLSLQLVWENPGYGSFDDFLARFRSKDRVKVKRQRRRLAEQGLRVEAATGDDLTGEHLEAMHGFYRATCAGYGTGSDYLQRGTWELLFRDWRERIVVLLAREASSGEPVGGSLCVQKGDALYGRYWGARRELDSLYFNLAFYEPIALAVERGWARFFAGAGTSWTKFARGFDAWRIRSVHKVFDPGFQAALARATSREAARIEEELARLRAASKLKPFGP